MNFAKSAVIAVVLTLSGVLPISAKDKEHGHGHGEKESHSKAEESYKSSKSDSKCAISIKEREIIQSYVSSYNEGKGHGKNKHHGLPPGLEKKLDRGGSLPPGWEKKVTVGEKIPVEVFKEAKPLPKELVVKLPPPPSGTLTVTIDGKIVRLMEATKTILDVFELPIPTLSKR